MGWLKQAEILTLPRLSLNDGKLQPVNRFTLLRPIFDLDIPHGCIKAFVTSEVFYGEGCHSLLMQEGN